VKGEAAETQFQLWF